MNLRRILGVAIFVVGVFLLVFGIHATGAIGERAVKEIKGRYTDTTMWYIIGGSVLVVIGGGLAFWRK